VSATLCLGEALVDFIAERPVASLAQADRFVPHVGGSAASVGVLAARAGGRVALGGAAGDDPWGRWLVQRLTAEGVGTDRLTLLADTPTQLAFVAVDDHGEPTYQLNEPVTDTFAVALRDDVEAAVDEASGLFLGSNTLAGSAGREVAMRARERALAQGTPVILDCSLHLHRWSSRADAAASVNACVPGAVLVCAGRDEAELLTGEPDPERAALALRKAGAEVVVIALGCTGAMLRAANRLSLDLAAPPIPELRSTVGARDALTGTLLAALERSGYYPDAAAAALDDGVAAAAQACTRWGALD
jgi:sugar/nucleoside kinase (ribokinase family)